MPVQYHTFPPPKHLAKYVRFFWVLESDAPYLHRQMADISPELIFHYRGRFEELTAGGGRKPSFRSGIHGQSSSISRFSIDKGFGIFGVYLYPYAIPALFQLSAEELTNRMPDLHSLWGGEGANLEEQVMLAGDNRERRKIITEFFSHKFLNKSDNSHHPGMFSAVRYVMNTKGMKTVEEVASTFCLSERQFARKFKEYSGFSPKLFSRITRFHTATECYGSGDKSLAEIAYECGYYDQSHFIQDFKEFSGHLPGEFFAGNAEGTEWREGKTSDFSNPAEP